MRLLLLGNPRTGSWKWDIEQAAITLGWDVTHLPARDIPPGDVVRQAKRANMLLWARTHRHNPAGDAATMLRRIEDGGAATVGLHLDLYWGHVRREPQIGHDPWWTCQTVYTADGGRRAWAARGVTHRWCPPAVGSRWLEPCTPIRTWPHRVVFVGTCSRLVHAGRQELLAWASRTYGSSFAHHGGRRSDRVEGHDLCGLYRHADVVLGDSAPAPYYWSDRIPATLARGAVLAHPHTDGLTGQGFTADTMLLYRRGDHLGLGRQIAELDPQRRAELADAGRQLVVERHLWEHRLVQIAAEVLT